MTMKLAQGSGPIMALKQTPVVIPPAYRILSRPSSSNIISPIKAKYDPTSPEFVPKTSTFGMNPESPPFEPAKLFLNPESPPFEPAKLILNPESPSFIPTTFRLDPESPSFKPATVTLNPESPPFEPATFSLNPIQKNRAIPIVQPIESNVVPAEPKSNLLVETNESNDAADLRKGITAPSSSKAVSVELKPSEPAGGNAKDSAAKSTPWRRRSNSPEIMPPGWVKNTNRSAVEPTLRVKKADSTPQQHNLPNPMTPLRKNPTPSQYYAAPGFHASPSASSLPKPRILSKPVSRGVDSIGWPQSISPRSPISSPKTPILDRHDHSPTFKEIMGKIAFKDKTSAASAASAAHSHSVRSSLFKFLEETVKDHQLKTAINDSRATSPSAFPSTKPRLVDGPPMSDEVRKQKSLELMKLLKTSK